MAKTEPDASLTELPKPLCVNGKFKTSWGNPGRAGNWEIAKFFTYYKNESNVPSQTDLDAIPEFQIFTPDYEGMKKAPKDGIQVTWLGHASVLFQIDGVNIISDPVFGEFCGYTQSKFVATKRFRDCRVDIGKLPQIHAVVISHDHYDHLDYFTVNNLNQRYGNSLRWYVPLGTKSWMHETGCTNVVELNWGDEHNLDVTIPLSNENEASEATDQDSGDSSTIRTVKMVFAPAQHWCTRTWLDQNTRLWGSWVMIGPKHRAYFAGDTGYCYTFKLVGDKYGPFDLAAIPIGAYRPRHFMKNQHIDPAEACKIHQDVKAKKSLGIHWGTFALGYENTREPPQLIRKCAKDSGIDDDFFILHHGESRVL
eukprot:gene6049-6751_t